MSKQTQMAPWGATEHAARLADIADVKAGLIPLSEAQSRARSRQRAAGLTLSQATTAEGKWEKQTGRYQSGEWYRVGKVIVGSVYYSGLRGRDDPKKYAVDCLLPGVKGVKDHFETIEQAKERLEGVVAAWFRATRESRP